MFATKNLKAHCDVALLLLVEDLYTKKQSNLAVSIKCTNVLQNLTLRDSPCGGMSKGATAVTTRGVPLLIWKNNIICFQLLRNSTCRHSYGGTLWRTATGAVAQHHNGLQVFGSECHVKNDYTFFPFNAENGFCHLHREISPLRVSKKYLRWCRRSRRIEWHPSWPPSFLAGQYL